MADEGELGSGFIRIDLRDDGADADVQRLGDRLERILDRASRDAGLRMERNINRAIRRIDPARIRVEADTTRFHAAVNHLNTLNTVQVRVEPDFDRFVTELQAHLLGQEVRISVVPDFTTFDNLIHAHRPPDMNVRVNPDFDESRLKRSLSGLLGGLRGAAVPIVGLSQLPTAIATVTQALGALQTAASGIGAALPAAALAGVAAFGTLKIATAGLGDAIKNALSDDPKKFAASLEKMSPAMASFAKTVRQAKPALDEFQKNVQSAFLDRFTGSLSGLGKALSPLQPKVVNLSKSFGGFTNELIKAVSTPQFTGALNSSLTQTTGIVGKLSLFVKPLGLAFSEMAKSVTDVFGPKIQKALGDAASRFSDFVKNAELGKKAVGWVDGAVKLFQGLGGVLSDVKGIFTGIADAANSAGVKGLAGPLSSVLDTLSKFTNSKSGQEALTGLFKTLDGINGIVKNLLKAIQPLLGPTLSLVSKTLDPIIKSVKDLTGSKDFTALSDSLGKLIKALEPIGGAVGAAIGKNLKELLPPFIKLTTLTADGLAKAAPYIAPFIELLSQLASFANKGIAAGLQPLIDGLPQVSKGLSDLAGNPNFQKVVDFLKDPLGSAQGVTLPSFDFSGLFNQALPGIQGFLSFIQGVPGQVQSALSTVGNFIAQPFRDGFAFAQQAVQTGVQFLQGLFSQLPTGVQSVLSTLGSIIAQPFTGGFQTAFGAVQSGISYIGSLFSQLGVAITNTLVGVGQLIVSPFTGGFAQAASAVSNGASRVASIIGGIPGTVRSVLSGLPGQVSSAFNTAKNAAVNTTTSLINSVRSILSGLPGQARAALSGIGGTLVSAGRQLIQGMINGVQSMATSLASRAKSVVSGAVSAAKSALGIHSPSKVFHEIGRNVGQGFINGLTGTQAQIKAAADKVIGSIQKAFKGKNTKLDDRLIKSIQSTSKRLQSLAAQRDKIAARIKAANDFAAQTTQSALQSFSLQNIAQSRGNDPTVLVKGIDAATAKVRKFTSQINSLAKRGLNKNLLSQLIGLGPDQGAALATSLANASAQQLHDLNDAQKQLDAAAKKLGKDSADALFDAGKNASKGFLAGLKAQQKQVEDLMISIAKSLTKAIKKALGIRSPSRVLARIGRQTMDGLRVGVDSQIAAVGRTSLRAANALTDPFGSVPRVSLSPARRTAPVALGRQTTTTGTRTVTNNNTFNVTTVGDPEVTARRIMQRLAAAGGGL